MVVFRKQIPAGSTGTSSEFGGDDINIYDKYFGNVDVTASVTNLPQIATPTTFNTSKLKIGNGTNSNKVTFTSSAQTGNFNINIPVLSGNIDLPISASGAALTGSSNTFTQLQTISADNERLLKLYRSANTTNNKVGIEFDHQNSSNAQTEFARYTAKLVTNTAGAEFGSLEEKVVKSGTLTTVRTIDASGNMIIGFGQNVGVSGYLKNNGATVTTSSTNTEFDMLNYTVPANLLGANGALRVTLSGYFLQNQASSTTFTLKIKFGGTEIFNDLWTRATQSATNLPFYLEFIIGNSNATNAQNMAGFIKVNDATSATTGQGDISDTSMTSNANFRGTDPAKDTTSNQVLQATMTMSINDANVQTSVRRTIIEYIPGI